MEEALVLLASFPGTHRQERSQPASTITTLQGAQGQAAPSLSGHLAAHLKLAQTAGLQGSSSQVIPETRNSPLALGGPSVLSFEKGISILFTFL